jgi:thioredoxin reductase
VQEHVQKGKIQVLFNSNPVEITPSSVILDVGGELKEVPNDFVWVFAGGEPPTAFLKKIGVKIGLRDMTTEGSSEAKQASNEARRTV